MYQVDFEEFAISMESYMISEYDIGTYDIGTEGIISGIQKIFALIKAQFTKLIEWIQGKISAFRKGKKGDSPSGKPIREPRRPKEPQRTNANGYHDAEDTRERDEANRNNWNTYLQHVIDAYTHAQLLDRDASRLIDQVRSAKTSNISIRQGLSGILYEIEDAEEFLEEHGKILKSSVQKCLTLVEDMNNRGQLAEAEWYQRYKGQWDKYLTAFEAAIKTYKKLSTYVTSSIEAELTKIIDADEDPDEATAKKAADIIEKYFYILSDVSTISMKVTDVLTQLKTAQKEE